MVRENVLDGSLGFEPWESSGTFLYEWAVVRKNVLDGSLVL